MTSTDGQPSPLFSAAQYSKDGKKHILLAATGSVATIKIPLIARALSAHYPAISVRIVFTRSAINFLVSQSAEQPTLSSLLALPGVDGVHEDGDEWSRPWVRGDGILHIELRRWAHVLVIAPLSANSLAKIVNGLSDGLLMSVVRAWDTTGMIDGVDGTGSKKEKEEKKKKKKRIFVAPAMNTAMWRHPVTKRQIKVLEEEWGSANDGEHGGNDGEGDLGSDNGWITVLRPIEKELACGDVGDGAMMDWRDIVSRVERYLSIDPQNHEKGGNG